MEDQFLQVANTVIAYKVRSVWLEMAKMYNDIAADYNATMSMGFTLLAIYEKGGAPVTKIAPRMGMEPNSLSRILKALEKQGAVYKRKDKSDKRKVYICLTEYGREMRRLALKAVFNLNKELVKDIEPEKLATFFEVIEQITQSMQVLREEID